MTDRDLRLVLGERDAGNDLLFHDFTLVANQCAGRMVGHRVDVLRLFETGAHEDAHIVHHRKLDRAHLHHLGAERRHLEHFLERDLLHAGRARHDARVGRVDAVDVGVDVAAVGLNGGRHSDRGSVRAAAPERGDAAGFLVQPLEARDDGDFLALTEALDQFRAVDVLDARGAVRMRGEDRQLPALPRACVHAHAFQHDREQPGGDLLARGDHRIVFARVMQRRCLARPGDELIGRARHGGDDDGDLVAGIDLALDVARDVADAVDIGDRRSAEFHDKAGH